MPLLASCHEHESILAYTSGKRQMGHAGVAGKSKHARWCLQWSRVQAHIQVNRLFGQLSFTAKSGVLAELIDVLAWSGSARIGLHTIVYILDISLLYLRLIAAPCREFVCLTSLWELQKEPEKTLIKRDVRHRYAVC